MGGERLPHDECAEQPRELRPAEALRDAVLGEVDLAEVAGGCGRLREVAGDCSARCGAPAPT